MTDVEGPNSHDLAQQHIDVDNESVGTAGTDERTPEQKKMDAELAERLSSIIEDANSRVIPLCKMIRKVFCLLYRQTALILILVCRISKTWKRRRKMTAMKASSLSRLGLSLSRPRRSWMRLRVPSKALILTIDSRTKPRGTCRTTKLPRRSNALPRLSRRYVLRPTLDIAHYWRDLLAKLMEEVHGTIEWAKDKLDSFPKAKKDLGPLLDALGRRFPFAIVMNVSFNHFHVSQSLWPKSLVELGCCWLAY